MTFLCTVYNHDYTFGAPSGTEPSAIQATRVATVSVRARSARAAAAKVYVRCVGRRRARLLKDVLQAPASLVRQETDWRAIAPGLMRCGGRMGTCYCFDNLVEAWFIQVQPADTPLPSRRVPSSAGLSIYYQSSPN